MNEYIIFNGCILCVMRTSCYAVYCFVVDSVGHGSRSKRPVDNHSTSVGSQDELFNSDHRSNPQIAENILRNDLVSTNASGKIYSSIGNTAVRSDLAGFTARPGAPVVVDRTTVVGAGAPRLGRNRSSEGSTGSSSGLVSSRDDTLLSSKNYELISPRSGAAVSIKATSAPAPLRRKNQDGSPVALAAPPQYVPSIGIAAPIRRIPSDTVAPRRDDMSGSVASSILSTGGSPVAHSNNRKTESSSTASNIARDYGSLGIRGSNINPSQRPSPTGSSPKVPIPVSPRSKQTKMDNYLESSSSVPKSAVSGGSRRLGVPINNGAVGSSAAVRPIPNNLQPPGPAASGVGSDGTKGRTATSVVNSKSPTTGDGSKSKTNSRR